MADLHDVLAGLARGTGASRVTLRRDVPGGQPFPVVEEALAPGVGSLRDERPCISRRQPVVLEVQRGRQVVQDDCAAAFDDPAFHAMLAAYGGLAAQIVTPVLAGRARSRRSSRSTSSAAAPVDATRRSRPRRDAAERVGELL